VNGSQQSRLTISGASCSTFSSRGGARTRRALHRGPHFWFWPFANSSGTSVKQLRAV